MLDVRSGRHPPCPGRAYNTFVKLVRDAGLSHLKLHGLWHINISCT